MTIRSQVIMLLFLFGCTAAPTKKILESDDYARWQRDLGIRANARPEDHQLREKLLKVAIVNEDFSTAQRQLNYLREHQPKREVEFSLLEISLLRNSGRLDECLEKIDTFSAKHEQLAERQNLPRLRALVKASKSLPTASISPYGKPATGLLNYAQQMSAPEVMYTRDHEFESFVTSIDKKPVKSPELHSLLGKYNEIGNKDDLDILSFPESPQGEPPQNPLPMLLLSDSTLSMKHVNGQEETLKLPGVSNCDLPGISPWLDYMVVACKVGTYYDLFLFKRASDGWAKAQLPGHLNSALDERRPRISPDGRYLFFSSNGFPGYGGADYMMSEITHSRICEKNNCTLKLDFSVPRNFGPAVNTYHNEEFPFQISSLDSRGHHVAHGHFYPLQAQPELVRIGLEARDTIPHRFIAYDGAQIAQARLEITSLRGDVRGPTGFSNEQQGDWIRLRAGAIYEITAVAPDASRVSSAILVPGRNQLAGRNYVIDRFSVRATDQTTVLTFAEDASSLSPEQISRLRPLGLKAATDKTLHVLIEGHTDSIGGADYNLALSHKRAAALKTQFLALGVPSHRITARGWGQSRPVHDNSSREHRAENRRVEVNLVLD